MQHIEFKIQFPLNYLQIELKTVWVWQHNNDMKEISLATNGVLKDL